MSQVWYLPFGLPFGFDAVAGIGQHAGEVVVEAAVEILAEVHDRPELDRLPFPLDLIERQVRNDVVDVAVGVGHQPPLVILRQRFILDRPRFGMLG